jgi:hypothetical protein
MRSYSSLRSIRLLCSSVWEKIWLRFALAPPLGEHRSRLLCRSGFWRAICLDAPRFEIARSNVQSTLCFRAEHAAHGRVFRSNSDKDSSSIDVKRNAGDESIRH